MWFGIYVILRNNFDVIFFSISWIASLTFLWTCRKNKYKNKCLFLNLLITEMVAHDKICVNLFLAGSQFKILFSKQVYYNIPRNQFYSR